MRAWPPGGSWPIATQGLASFSGPEAPGAWSPVACGFLANRSAGHGLISSQKHRGRGLSWWGVASRGVWCSWPIGAQGVTSLFYAGGVASQAAGGVASRGWRAPGQWDRRGVAPFHGLPGRVGSRPIGARGVASFPAPRLLGAWSPGACGLPVNRLGAWPLGRPSPIFPGDSLVLPGRARGRGLPGCEGRRPMGAGGGPVGVAPVGSPLRVSFPWTCAARSVPGRPAVLLAPRLVPVLVLVRVLCRLEDRPGPARPARTCHPPPVPIAWVLGPAAPPGRDAFWLPADRLRSKAAHPEGSGQAGPLGTPLGLAWAGSQLGSPGGLGGAGYLYSERTDTP